MTPHGSNVKIYESFKRRQDGPFLQTNIGRACLYDERPGIVKEVSPGEYGERVTIEVDGFASQITTTPGLDPRFRWP